MMGLEVFVEVMEDMSYSKLAEIVGISKAGVQGWFERGKIPKKHLFGLSKYFGSSEELLSKELTPSEVVNVKIQILEREEKILKSTPITANDWEKGLEKSLKASQIKCKVIELRTLVNRDGVKSFEEIIPLMKEIANKDNAYKKNRILFNGMEISFESIKKDRHKDGVWSIFNSEITYDKSLPTHIIEFGVEEEYNLHFFINKADETNVFKIVKEGEYNVF